MTEQLSYKAQLFDHAMVATDIHSGCRHLQGSVEDLSALAEQLENMVGQFKV